MNGKDTKHAAMSTVSCAAASPFLSTFAAHSVPVDAASSHVFSMGVILGRLAAFCISFAAIASSDETLTQPVSRRVDRARAAIAMYFVIWFLSKLTAFHLCSCRRFSANLRTPQTRWCTPVGDAHGLQLRPSASPEQCRSYMRLQSATARAPFGPGRTAAAAAAAR